ncbi:MAG: polysaccharide deacetylase family protein, partial [Candidatus Acidiferrales bacterium]
YVGIRPSDWLAWHDKGTPLPEKPVMLTFDDAYGDLVEYAFPVLERHQFGAAVFVVTAQVGKDNAWDRAQGWGALPIMTREQIQEWATRGIEFGSHSRMHPDLTTLPAQQLQEEIAESAKELAEILGSPAVSFAYPYGEYDEKALAATRSSFQLAFTCEEGLNNLCGDLYRLRRTMVLPGESRAALAWRVRWGYNPLARLRERLRLRTRLRQGLAMIRGAKA